MGTKPDFPYYNGQPASGIAIRLAVGAGQFDDLDSPAWDMLRDENDRA